MKLNTFIFVLILSLGSGCSGKKSVEKEASVDLTDLDATPIEEIEEGSVIPLDTEMLSEDQAEAEELIVEVEPSSIYDEQDRFNEELAVEEISVASDEYVVPATDSELSAAPPIEDEEILADSSEITKIIEKSNYKIQKNDTLMLVAWKIYGDTSRWRELKSLNESKLHNGYLWIGEELVFNRPETEFSWSPEGSPYLIKNGDTLGGISKDVYNQAKYWQAIWYNNRDLIRDPDLIYAGFTIYYKDLEQVNHREIASKIKLFQKSK